MSRRKSPVNLIGQGKLKAALEAAGVARMASVYAMGRAYLDSVGKPSGGARRKMLATAYKLAAGLVMNERPTRSAAAPAKATKEAFYRSWEWSTMRMEVLKQYGRQCMCCGALPGNGVVIHVDHIKPLHTNWELRLDRANLQVLCDTCNKGKGAWDETDYRPDSAAAKALTSLDDEYRDIMGSPSVRLN